MKNNALAHHTPMKKSPLPMHPDVRPCIPVLARINTTNSTNNSIIIINPIKMSDALEDMLVATARTVQAAIVAATTRCTHLNVINRSRHTISCPTRSVTPRQVHRHSKYTTNNSTHRVHTTTAVMGIRRLHSSNRFLKGNLSNSDIHGS